MVNIEKYIAELTLSLKEIFNKRLLYVGLQGSYLRKEATENSDIDIMVIIDKLSVSDLKAYRQIIENMEYFDKSCGFICSKEDLLNWNPLEIASLLGSTEDYYGTLSDFTPNYTEKDIKNYIRISLNNLYHEICHRYIHGTKEQNIINLPFTYKGVFFILQNIYLLKTGKFILCKADLLCLLNGIDEKVMNKAIELSKNKEYDFDESFSLLFTWCQETLKNL